MGARSSLTRTLKELRTLYELKPSMRDIYVEGSSDVKVIRAFLREKGVDSSIQVYAVDDRANVPRVEVEEIHPEVNARGRVVTLAAASRDWNIAKGQITCIIDKDYDALDDQAWDLNNLLVTDYPSMEVYALKPVVLDRFLARYTNGSDVAESLLSELLALWRFVFAVRYALHRSGLGVAPAKKWAELLLASTSGSRAASEHLEAILPPGVDGEALRQQIAAAEGRLGSPGPHNVRGHDIAPLLIARLKLRNGKASVDMVEAMLLAGLVAADIEQERLFVGLLSRLTED